ncbi:hypothetical protein CbuD7D7780_06630 [Coxiella burnetii]|uniref:Hypothetical membrane associated protein n=1 Tax=Coxiella burnetii (strain Dugway 5J108-111) TaxID=434922 RepID=B5XHE0_COXBN|nr:hypothetical protein [Coxiella burnetii]ACI23160.1 hypothetical membrane associated protein [Coxiella burnetii Dugway 5J108-111]OYK80054.1 hypothetical protein CbuD7E6568_06600 [Coxiella burnetii]OYK82135.1 hypothetical protein CbuD7D7780_06630 [Coxiella burnetii]
MFDSKSFFCRLESIWLPLPPRQPLWPESISPYSKCSKENGVFPTLKCVGVALALLFICFTNGYKNN